MLEQYHAEGWSVAKLIRPLGCNVNFQIEVENIEQVLSREHVHSLTLYRNLRDNHCSTGEATVCHLIQDPDRYLLRFSQHFV